MQKRKRSNIGATTGDSQSGLGAFNVTIDKTVDSKVDASKSKIEPPAVPKTKNDSPKPKVPAVPKEEETTKPPIILELPNDFKSHSSLFSADQLNQLRSVVYMKKATIDRRFSIKDAIYEAFNMIFEGERKPLDKYPKDFITYSPLVSMVQFERLNSFVYTIKAKDDSKYAMKYAIYEAIQMYLDSNPKIQE